MSYREEKALFSFGGRGIRKGRSVGERSKIVIHSTLPGKGEEKGRRKVDRPIRLQRGA